MNTFCGTLEQIIDVAGGMCIGELEIDALLIQPGDILEVLPGTKIPTDDAIEWGSSYVNESRVTGESVPLLKEVNLSVIGGTINLTASLTCELMKQEEMRS